jgi:hypothetical protein
MEKDQKFIISGTNDILWNYQELTKYLALNQNKHIALKIIPEAIPLQELGVYQLLDNFKFASVDIYTENQLEKHHKYNIIVDTTNRWLKHKPKIPDNLHQWSGLKTFLAFYHRPTASRLGLASYLYVNYNNVSTIHFSYATDIDRLQFYEFDKLALLRKESLSDVTKMIPHMPLIVYADSDVDEVMSWYDYNRDSGIALYKDIFVDVISEAHVSGKTFYPTEKIARPMWLKKPFLVFGSKDFLCYLRQMGFQTFWDYIDETYDGYEGRERYIKMLEVIDTLGKKTKDELQQMYKDMQPVLEHNYNLLQTQSYTETISLIID